jgi:ankyrin repeat protein
MLLQHGADVNCLADNIPSPLHIAARFDNSNTLLQHGADVNCINKEKTVLYI